VIRVELENKRAFLLFFYGLDMLSLSRELIFVTKSVVTTVSTVSLVPFARKHESFNLYCATLHFLT
jgi:hypothetical protein